MTAQSEETGEPVGSISIILDENVDKDYVTTYHIQIYSPDGEPIIMEIDPHTYLYLTQLFGTNSVPGATVTTDVDLPYTYDEEKEEEE